MKFTVQGKEFFSQISAAAKVLNSKNTVGILDNLLIRLEGNQLFITCSDSENVLTASMEAYDCEEGKPVAIGAKRLIEVVKEISNMPITFTVKDDFSVNVNYLNGEFNFMGTDGSLFPNVSEMESDVKSISVPKDVVKKGLSSTLFAVASESVRPIMTGVCWDFKETELVFASSDTHKLVRYINRNYAPGEELTFVLHSKTSSVVNSLLDSVEDEMVEVSLDSKSAIFRFGPYCLNCRFLKGKYPNYNRVIPADNPFEIVLDRQTLLSAVKRIGIFSSSASHLVKFCFENSQLNLAAQDVDYSIAANEKMSCDYEGAALTLGFRADYTEQVLANIPGDTVVMKVCDQARPSLFMPFEQASGEEMVVLQMPLNVIE